VLFVLSSMMSSVAPAVSGPRPSARAVRPKALGALGPAAPVASGAQARVPARTVRPEALGAFRACGHGRLAGRKPECPRRAQLLELVELLRPHGPPLSMPAARGRAVQVGRGSSNRAKMATEERHARMMSRMSEAEPPESETSRPHGTRRPTEQQKPASRQPQASLSTSPHIETGSKLQIIVGRPGLQSCAGTSPERVAVAGSWEIKETWSSNWARSFLGIGQRRRLLAWRAARCVQA
jgi:hypothetical protein